MIFFGDSMLLFGVYAFFGGGQNKCVLRFSERLLRRDLKSIVYLKIRIEIRIKMISIYDFFRTIVNPSSKMNIFLAKCNIWCSEDRTSGKSLEHCQTKHTRVQCVSHELPVENILEPLATPQCMKLIVCREFGSNLYRSLSLSLSLSFFYVCLV